MLKPLLPQNIQVDTRVPPGRILTIGLVKLMLREIELTLQSSLDPINPSGRQHTVFIKNRKRGGQTSPSQQQFQRHRKLMNELVHVILCEKHALRVQGNQKFLYQFLAINLRQGLF